MEINRLSALFRSVSDWSLRHPWEPSHWALYLPVSGFLAAGSLTNQFFPAPDRTSSTYRLRYPDSAAIEDTLALVDVDVEPRLAPWRTAGKESAPAFYL